MQVKTVNGVISTEDLFISIEENERGRKYVHILGYVYYCDGDSEHPYRGVEYTHFYANFEDVERGKIFAYERDNCEDVKTYIKELTEHEAEKYIKKYDFGSTPPLIGAKYLTKDIDYGIYAVKFNKEVN